MINNSHQERRLSQRIEGTYFAKYRFFDPVESHLDIQEHEAATIDISRTGVALITEKQIPTGSHLLIKFSIKRKIGNTLSSCRKIVVFTGMVVYSAPLGEDHYRIGIYFGPSNENNEMKFIEILSSPSSPFEFYPKKCSNATLHVGA